MYSLAQAAQAAGKSKPTISRAIKAGRLSATRTDDGSYAIDPAELARVFPLTRDSTGTMKQSVPGNGASAHPGEIDGLRLLLAEREETIRDLRVRLDAEADERRRVQEQLTGLLTHRQAGSVPAVMPRVQVSWWRRWFR